MSFFLDHNDLETSFKKTLSNLASAALHHFQGKPRSDVIVHRVSHPAMSPPLRLLLVARHSLTTVPLAFSKGPGFLTKAMKIP